MGGSVLFVEDPVVGDEDISEPLVGVGVGDEPHRGADRPDRFTFPADSEPCASNWITAPSSVSITPLG